MDVFTAIKKRRSIRRFLPKPVPDNIIRKIIEAGLWAPSDCNLQGWNFILVDDPGLKERLAKEAGTNMRILKSPVTVVLCYDKYDPLIGLQSLSAGVQNMMLAATSLGIASCWLASCGNREKIKEILDIPKEMHVASIVVFGYPQYSVKDPPPRKPFELVTHRNKFSSKYHISYSHEPKNWTLEQLNFHQYYYCRKNPFGVQQDIVNEKEVELLKSAIPQNINGKMLDLFTYDGSYLRCFPKASVTTLDLNKETAKYTSASGEVHGVKTDNLIFDMKRKLIPLPDRSVSLVTCFFRLERLPPDSIEPIIREVCRILKPGGTFLIAVRPCFSLYSLMYRLIRLRFDDDIRKTAMFSFFGPYKPVSVKSLKNILKNSGFSASSHRFLLIPPHAENIHQLYLQYKVSAGTSYTYRIKRETALTRFLSYLLEKQGTKKSLLGSVAVIEAKKVR